MLCNIKPVLFHKSDKHIFAKIPGGVRTPGPPPLDPPMTLNSIPNIFLNTCIKKGLVDLCVGRGLILEYTQRAV